MKVLRRTLPALPALALLTGLLLLPLSRALFTDVTDNPGNNFRAGISTFRLTTYEIRAGTFPGSSYTLTLTDPLASDYFVILRGGAGNNTGSGGRGPDENYARITADPHGNFASTTAADELQLTRGNTTGSWQGQVTVVESLADQSASGFSLVGVAEVTMATGVTSASVPLSSGSWSALGQVGLYGGVRGGGVSTDATATSQHITGWARVYPSGSNTVNLLRQAGGGGSLAGTTTFTVYAVEWGSQWTIQRVTVSGTEGGNGIDDPSEYTQAALSSSVDRDETFVLAYGRTWDNGIGNGWEGHSFTLGDGGTPTGPTESEVAVGAEYSVQRDAEVYVHTHPDLAVDYVFAPDGSIGSGALSGNEAIAAPLSSESYTGGGVRTTSGYRLTILANGSNGTGNAYPRPMVWSRPTAATNAEWTRSRSGQPGVFWLQSVDFGFVRY